MNEAQAHVGSWEWHCREVRLEWSDELYRIFGYLPSGCEVGYTHFMQRVHPDDRIYVEKYLASALEEDKGTWLDGSVRHIRDSGIVERDGTGRPVRCGASCTISPI